MSCVTLLTDVVITTMAWRTTRRSSPMVRFAAFAGGKQRHQETRRCRVVAAFMKCFVLNASLFHP